MISNIHRVAREMSFQKAIQRLNREMLKHLKRTDQNVVKIQLFTSEDLLAIVDKSDAVTVTSDEAA